MDITQKHIALVGMMGVGKSKVGRHVADMTGRTFVDSDKEIELAAGMAISDIFARYGEAYFRDRETMVLRRMLGCGTPLIIATGGGAYMSELTRTRLKCCAVTVWLKADLDILVSRAALRPDRPLLQGEDPRAVIQSLLDARVSSYAEADYALDTSDLSIQAAAAAICEMIGFDKVASHGG